MPNGKPFHIENLGKLFPGYFMKNLSTIHMVVLYVFLGSTAVGGINIWRLLESVPEISDQVESIKKDVPVIYRRLTCIEKEVASKLKILTKINLVLEDLENNALTRQDLVSLIRILQQDDALLRHLTKEQIENLFRVSDMDKLIKKEKRKGILE